MSDYINAAGMQVERSLFDLVNNEIMPGTGIDPDHFWQEFAEIASDIGKTNRELLKRRDQLQQLIDQWHIERKGQPHDAEAYKAFLYEIGYLLEEGIDFTISTSNVDPEIASVAGPQLVVPVNNARYDALYGTDVIPHDESDKESQGFSPARGKKVIAYANRFLDEYFPLQEGKQENITGYHVDNGQLIIALDSGKDIGLVDPDQFAGYSGDPARPSAILLKQHGLHVEIRIDREHPIGKHSPAGVKDVMLEAAVRTLWLLLMPRTRLSSIATGWD